MSKSTAQAPSGALTDYSASIQEDIVENRFIKNALNSLAELRKYILIEHPQDLAEAAPGLVLAEETIFDIRRKLQT